MSLDIVVLSKSLHSSTFVKNSDHLWRSNLACPSRLLAGGLPFIRSDMSDFRRPNLSALEVSVSLGSGDLVKAYCTQALSGE